jgi:hypothetical protein
LKGNKIKKTKTKIPHCRNNLKKSNRIVVERGKITTPSTQIHDCLISWVGTGTSIKSGGVNHVLWNQIVFIYLTNIFNFGEYWNKISLRTITNNDKFSYGHISFVWNLYYAIPVFSDNSRFLVGIQCVGSMKIYIANLSYIN